MTQNACEFPPSSVRNRCEINANLGQFAPVLPGASPLSFIGVGRFKWWSWGDSNPRPRKAGRAFLEVGAKLVRICPWLILAVALTACGGGGSSVAPAPAADARPTESNMPMPVHQVAAYGDSTQFEQGDPHPAGAPDMWVKNAAYGGATAATMLAGYADKGLPWAQEMAKQAAPVVVFNPGINDHPYTVAQYRENLRSLVTIAQAAGKFVMLEEPNPAGETETPLMASIAFDVAAFEARRAAMRDLAGHMGVYFCAQPRVPLRDGIHPTADGYLTKAKRLNACLVDAL